MIVMKFSGPTIESADAIRSAAQLIQTRLPKKPVLVISAAGDTTDLLLESIDHALKGDSDQAIEKVQQLHEYHLTLAEELELTDDLLVNFKETVQEYRSELTEFMTGTSLVHNLSPKSIDRMLPFGERYSSLLVTYFLKQIGLDANMLDSTQFIVTTDEHTQAKPLLEESADKVRDAILPLIGNDEIPLVQGFIGSTKAGDPSTLGRGGSDYTASILQPVFSVQHWKRKTLRSGQMWMEFSLRIRRLSKMPRL